MFHKPIMLKRIVMVPDESEGFGTPHIVDQIIDVERPCWIDPKLSAGKFKYCPFRLHHTGLVGIDAIAEECVKELILRKDVVVVDAADIGEKIEWLGLME